MRLSAGLILSCLLGVACGQGLNDWQSGSRLQAGDRVRLSLNTGHVDGALQNWTPEDIKVGTVTAKREEVLKIERYRRGGSRAKHAGIGALIGFGGGFAVGAAVDGGCNRNSLGPCAPRPEGGAIVGAAGAILGALIGAVLPVHSKDLIYSK